MTRMTLSDSLMTWTKLLRIALLIVLMTPSLGGSSIAYVCTMDGRVHRQCCCDRHVAAKADCAKLEKRGCCDVRSTGSEQVSNSTRIASLHHPACLAVAPRVTDLASNEASSRLEQYRDYAADDPPVFLSNCSLLR